MTGQVVLSDINAAMLSEGRKNLINKGVSGVQFVQLSGVMRRFHLKDCDIHKYQILHLAPFVLVFLGQGVCE
jgi:hypothetical protein